ncbi:MAG: DUF2812 domain-containing protein [Lachnospiraceae bacterium]|nr:DUF2812 domain-containing protein [Lachnospiraceae bacterium]
MNVLYRPTLFSPAFIRETEQFYNRMAQKGWLLEKIGPLFLKFKKGSPENRTYRIVLPETNHIVPFEAIPDEQAARYREAGWELLPSNSSFQVLTTPEGISLPEPYQTQEDAFFLIRYLNRLRKNLVLLLVFLVLLPGIIALFFGVNHPLRRLTAAFFLTFYTDTGSFLFYFFTYALILLHLLREAFYGQRLKTRIQAGEPWASRELSDHRFGRGLSLLFACAACLGLLLLGVQKYTARSLPYREASGPYLDARDLGLDESWRWVDFDLDTYEYVDAGITRTNTPFSQIWESSGTFRNDLPVTHSFYQTVYRAASPALAGRIASLLEWKARLTDNCGAFEPFPPGDLDRASCVLSENHQEYILVKNDTVWHLSILGSGWASPETFFRAAAEKAN